MPQWRLTQLTHGTGDCRYHSHSYYDIPVFDPASRWVAAHEMTFSDRHITPCDTIAVGVVDVVTRQWRTVGHSSAWSWQQGPMAQWSASDPALLFWNDRDGDQFVTRIWNKQTERCCTLARASYAIDPGGQFTWSINMARLDTLRPGYGYAGGVDPGLDNPAPAGDGVWRQSIESGEARLVLSLARARDFLLSRMTLPENLGARGRRPCFWFNHVKISPSGRRFTIKLRFRELDGGWSDEQGVSLTCNVDGSDLRLLAAATSHVIWYDEQQLFLWQRDGFYFFADDAPEGRRLSAIAPRAVTKNAHIRYLPHAKDRFVVDTPYSETIDLFIYDEAADAKQPLGRFEHHRPARSAFRCDLHPCPSPDGRRIVVTSFHDGGRQIYCATADDPMTDTGQCNG